MDLRIDTLFSDDPEPPHDGPRDLEAALLALGSADMPHPEDAFLAEFARWLCARRSTPEQRRPALELAREALELVGDPEGPWQGLPIASLLQSADGCAAAPLVERARELVSWLCESGRLSLHGQRLLARRLAAVRVATRPLPPAAPLAA